MRTSAHLLRKYAPAAVGRPGPRTRTGTAGWTRRSRGPPYSMERATGHPRARVADAHRLRRSPRIHGDDGENFVELAVPSSPALGGAGNGTSAYLLRKSAPAAAAYRRPCLLAINASRLFNARTLAGSSPGALLKKTRHRDGAVLVLLTGAGNGTRTRECQLGKLMPYHLAMPACVLASITRLSCSIQGWRCLF